MSMLPWGQGQDLNKMEFIRVPPLPPACNGGFSARGNPLAIGFKWFSFTNAVSLRSCSLLLEDPNVGTGCGGEGGMRWRGNRMRAGVWCRLKMGRTTC